MRVYVYQCMGVSVYIRTAIARTAVSQHVYVYVSKQVSVSVHGCIDTVNTYIPLSLARR